MRKATTKEIIAKLGQPKQSTSNLVRLNLPYPMKLSWAKQTIVRSILVHPYIKKQLENLIIHLPMVCMDFWEKMVREKQH